MLKSKIGWLDILANDTHEYYYPNNTGGPSIKVSRFSPNRITKNPHPQKPIKYIHSKKKERDKNSQTNPLQMLMHTKIHPNNHAFWMFELILSHLLI